MASAAAAVAAASAAAAPPLFLPPASSNSRTAAAVETVDFDGLRQHSIRSDLEFIEKELKDWFLCRRLRMERNMALKKLFDHHHFVGLSQNDPTLNAAERSIWKDIVSGKPELEDSLSLDAKEMKADMLMDIFKRATDLEHPCRMPGVAYFRCLRENFKAAQRDRSSTCLPAFSAFESCRSALKQQQAAALESSMNRQDMEDIRAKQMFKHRAALLDALSGARR